MFSGLKKQNTMYIEVRSRIWNSTLVEDYSNVDWVQIYSRASVEIMDTSFKTKEGQSFLSEVSCLSNNSIKIY